MYEQIALGTVLPSRRVAIRGSQQIVVDGFLQQLTCDRSAAVGIIAKGACSAWHGKKRVSKLRDAPSSLVALSPPPLPSHRDWSWPNRPRPRRPRRPIKQKTRKAER